MTEAFLHFLWERQYFDKVLLRTTEGEKLAIYFPGQPNRNAGPDFFQARVRIGDVQWIGNVEIHVTSSGWYDHHHGADRAYDNVVLHVVWLDNKPVQREDGTRLPTVELKSRIPETLLHRYRLLENCADKIPCGSRLSSVPDKVKHEALQDALQDRMVKKANRMVAALNRNRGDWRETAYQMLARNFGFHVNAEPFHQLALSLPGKIVAKHANHQLQTEALFFGQAGLLNTMSDDPYFLGLQREYRLLGRKYNLYATRLDESQWRFLRMRPANFPTVRIAQFAAVCQQHVNLFSSLISVDSRKDAHDLFSVLPSAYWSHHYRFFGVWSQHGGRLGAESIDNLIINTIVPLQTAYGSFKGDQVYIGRAVRILQSMAAEVNHVTKIWNTLGMTARNAADAQGMMELYQQRCLKRLCLRCSIGRELVNPTTS